MNEEYFKYAVEKVNNLTSDDIRMIAKTHGLELVPKPIASRNKREGRFVGKAWGKVVRVQCSFRYVRVGSPWARLLSDRDTQDRVKYWDSDE